MSPSLNIICLCIFLAILESAAKGSPCVPVHRITTSLSLYCSTLDIGISKFLGIFNLPTLGAISNTFNKLLPSIAIFLPKYAALSIICCILWTCEANTATTILPVAFWNSCLKASPTLLSEGVKPSTSEFVESESIKSTPSSPNSDSLTKSTFSLSTGVKSILKSPVINTWPAGVFIDKE